MSKPTHLLIPIEYLEDKIAYYKRIEDQQNHETSYAAMHIKKQLKTVLYTGKQISLDEQGIEERAERVASLSQAKYPTQKHAAKSFIKQGLKDILQT